MWDVKARFNRSVWEGRCALFVLHFFKRQSHRCSTIGSRRTARLTEELCVLRLHFRSTERVMDRIILRSATTFWWRVMAHGGGRNCCRSSLRASRSSLTLSTRICSKLLDKRGGVFKLVCKKELWCSKIDYENLRGFVEFGKSWKRGVENISRRTFFRTSPREGRSHWEFSLWGPSLAPGRGDLWCAPKPPQVVHGGRSCRDHLCRSGVLGITLSYFSSVRPCLRFSEWTRSWRPYQLFSPKGVSLMGYDWLKNRGVCSFPKCIASKVNY